MSGVGDWCHPGDDQRQRWILMFEDQDKGLCVYYNEDEAFEAFQKAEMNWNCHLFTSVPRKDAYSKDYHKYFNEQE